MEEFLRGFVGQPLSKFLKKFWDELAQNSNIHINNLFMFMCAKTGNKKLKNPKDDFIRFRRGDSKGFMGISGKFKEISMGIAWGLYNARGIFLAEGFLEEFVRGFGKLSGVFKRVSRDCQEVVRSGFRRTTEVLRSLRMELNSRFSDFWRGGIIRLSRPSNLP